MHYSLDLFVFLLLHSVLIHILFYPNIFAKHFVILISRLECSAQLRELLHFLQMHIQDKLQNNEKAVKTSHFLHILSQNMKIFV